MSNQPEPTTGLTIIRSDPARGLNDGQIAQYLETYSVPVLIAVEKNILRAVKTGRLYLRPDSPIPEMERLRLYQYAAAWMHLALSDFERMPDGRMAAWTRGWTKPDRVLVSYEQKAKYNRLNPEPQALAQVGGIAPPGTYYWDGTRWSTPPNYQGNFGPHSMMYGAAVGGDWKAIVSLSIVTIIIWRLSVLTSGQGSSGWPKAKKKKERVGRPADWLNTPTEGL